MLNLIGSNNLFYFKITFTLIRNGEENKVEFTSTLDTVYFFDILIEINVITFFVNSSQKSVEKVTSPIQFT